MSDMIKRRDFFKKSMKAGLGVATGAPMFSKFIRLPFPASVTDALPDVTVAAGSDYLRNTLKAVEMLGGMSKFVPKGSRVGLLPNVQSRHPGTFTKPDILRAVIRLCKEAGAKEINILSWQPMKSWEDTGLAPVAAEEGANLRLFEPKDETIRKVPIPNGKNIKEAMIMSELYNNDVLINLPITKDHAGNKFTGTMKNMMGLNSRSCNRTFHKENWTKDIGAIEYLDQCVVDLNQVLKPDLHIVDATEFIITGGPMGPGEIQKSQKVVAGTDRVAIDAYCCGLWGHKPEDIFAIKFGGAQGLGRMDLGKIKVQEIKI